MTAARQQTVTVWQGRVPLRVHVKGTGPAVIFFHGPWGLTWGPFLDALARGFTVYAPEHPGTTPGEPDAVQQVDSLWDLALCYDELLEHLRLSEVMLVGHSFGAMMACEVAALRSARVRRLVLIDPIGFWRDDAPVVNWMLLGPQEIPADVFREPAGEAAKALFSIPEDPEDAALARTRLTWAMGSTGKFIWPIPDREVLDVGRTNLVQGDGRCSSAGFAGGNLRMARLGRTGPSPWPSCGSHCLLGGGSEGGRSPPPSVLVWGPGRRPAENDP